MGKEKPGFLTPKAIANRIKAKGLQKLRWYCQMCEKQCRDENGFKCHLMSESHQRQLLLFADNSGKYMDDFSRSFKSGYLLTLRRRFGTKRVHANVVYQEYINDRDHIHMNSTKWLTLTDFVQYLGREGHCVVDQTEKGWFVQYIDRDPETIKRQLELEKKRKLDLDDRERQIIYMEKQMEREKSKDTKKTEFSEIKKNDDLKISFKLNKKYDEDKKSKDENEIESPLEYKNEKRVNYEKNIYSDENSESKPDNLNLMKAKSLISNEKSKISVNDNKKRKLNALDEVIQLKEIEREKQNRKDYWLHKNIIVKIITNKLGEKYKDKKGVVISVIDSYVGIIKIIGMDSIIKVDQSHLETVIPAVGKKVLVVNGAYRGCEAVLEKINENDYSAKIHISSGPLMGRTVDNIQYEDICKLQVEDSS